MSEFDINKLTQIPKLVSSKNLNPHHYKCLDIDIAAFPGQPNVTFANADHSLFIAVCTAPMVSMDLMIPCGLSYTVTVTATKQVTNPEVAEAVCAVMEKFDMKYVKTRTDDTSTNGIVFRIGIDKCEPEDGPLGPVYRYFVMATIEVEQNEVDHVIHLCEQQIKRVSPSPTSSKH